jgi:hypothetical protein
MLPRVPGIVRTLSMVLLAVVSAGMAAWFSLPWPKPPTDNDVVLARVGDLAITVRDFQRNYEFGYPHLKEGPDPISRKRAYLRAMVNELLIASEGFVLGLDRSPVVADQDAHIATELLTEALIRAEVVAKAHVTDAEVREAITKSNVNFKVRYWGEPSLVQAEAVRHQMVRTGFVPVVDSLRRFHADVHIDASMLESGEMSAFDTEPEVLAAIKDLEIGGFSAPVPLNGGYYIFQVTDIRRRAIMELEYTAKFETMKKVLLNGKYDEGIESYVGGFMTAKNVVTKARPFGALCNAVVEWKVTGDHHTTMLRDAVFSSHAARPSYGALAAMKDEPIVTHEGSNFTVAELLDVFMPALRDIDPGNMPRVRHVLSEQVALCVRDQLLAAEARRRGMDASPAFVHEREQWLRKAVYDQACAGIAGRMAGSDGIRTARAALERKADSLRAFVPVTINETVLDTLTVFETSSSRMLGMQVFKLGSKRPAMPVTDGIWGRLE